MPRRPRGPDDLANPLEDGLRKLVLETGPSSKRLTRDQSAKPIMEAAHPPASWSIDEKATAVLLVIYELINEMSNPRWKAATMAAFRLPSNQYVGSSFDSVAGRWRGLARSEGAFSSEDISANVEKYRGYWMTAASHLADALEDRFKELNRSMESWNRYRPEGLQPPPLSLPISFDRTEVLYTFDGYRGVQSTSHRWLTAHGEVDHYEAVGWYFSDPDAPVAIVPLANCVLDGPLRELPQGGCCGTLKFSHVLKSDEKYYFSYSTIFNSDRPCRPTILYEVRGLSMRSLTIRAQFDLAAMPTKCWFFDVGVQVEGSVVPPDGAKELLSIASNGYVEHVFEHCERGRKYGLRWHWPEMA